MQYPQMLMFWTPQWMHFVCDNVKQYGYDYLYFAHSWAVRQNPLHPTTMTAEGVAEAITRARHYFPQERLMPAYQPALSNGLGHTFEDWFRAETWDTIVETSMKPLREMGALRRDMLLDFEAYAKEGDPGWPRRYPYGSDTDRLVLAQQSFWSYVRENRLRIYLLPGGMTFIHTLAVPPDIQLWTLDELTFDDPNVHTYRNYSARLLNRRYLAGIQSRKMRHDGGREMREKGIAKGWAFTRWSDDPQLFGTPHWLKPAIPPEFPLPPEPEPEPEPEEPPTGPGVPPELPANPSQPPSNVAPGPSRPPGGSSRSPSGTRPLTQPPNVGPRKIED